MKTVVFCLFCGKAADSMDHIPPKALLERPFPDNLLTIPLCRKCNTSFSMDEEYFLNVLAEISTNPLLLSKKKVGGSIYRARKRSKGLRKRIENSLVKAGDGRTYFQSEWNRMKRVIEKIACGLYFHKYKTIARLEKFQCNEFYPFSILDMRPAEIVLLPYTERFSSKRWTMIQNGIFSYIVVKDWRRSDGLSMFLNMYDSVWCVIAIPRPNSRRKPSKLGTHGQQKLFEKLI